MPGRPAGTTGGGQGRLMNVATNESNLYNQANRAFSQKHARPALPRPLDRICRAPSATAASADQASDRAGSFQAKPKGGRKSTG